MNAATNGLAQASVYVAPGTEHTDATTAGSLAGQLTSDDHIVIAMLPAVAASEFGSGEAGAQQFAAQLDQATGHSHIVAVSVGDQVATATTLLSPGVAADQMNRAAGVSTNTTETLTTFIRDVHDWESANPAQVTPSNHAAAKSGNGSHGISAPVVIMLSVVLFGLGTAGIARLRRTRGRSTDEEKIKLHSPKRIHDELQGILGTREQIQDTQLRETITQLVKDTEMVFRRLRENTSPDMDTTAITFEGHLQSVQEVLERYIEIQNYPRYYENPDAALASGRKAISGFAEYALTSARRAGQRGLTEFTVNTKILNAQRYA